jgi:hypothetical protein
MAPTSAANSLPPPKMSTAARAGTIALKKYYRRESPICGNPRGYWLPDQARILDLRINIRGYWCTDGLLVFHSTALSLRHSVC